MAKYKVLEEFVLNGVTLRVNEIVELDFQKANLKSIQGKIEKAPEVNPDKSVLGGVIPGVPLTPEQKEKLSKENADASAEAHRLAADARGRDIAEGREKPAVAVVADALKQKLELGEFEKKEGIAPLPGESNDNPPTN